MRAYTKDSAAVHQLDEGKERSSVIATLMEALVALLMPLGSGLRSPSVEQLVLLEVRHDLKYLD